MDIISTIATVLIVLTGAFLALAFGISFLVLLAFAFNILTEAFADLIGYLRNRRY